MSNLGYDTENTDHDKAKVEAKVRLEQSISNYHALTPGITSTPTVVTYTAPDTIAIDARSSSLSIQP